MAATVPTAGTPAYLAGWETGGQVSYANVPSQVVKAYSAT